MPSILSCKYVVLKWLADSKEKRKGKGKGGIRDTAISFKTCKVNMHTES